MSTQPVRPPAASIWSDAPLLPATHQGALDALHSVLKPGDGVVLHLADGMDPLTGAMSAEGYDVAEVRLSGRQIDGDAFESLIEYAQSSGARVVMARRVLPELWDRVGEERYRAFVEMLARSGVQALISEGRATSVRTTHPLGTPEAEWKSLSPWWVTQSTHGAIRTLKPGKAAAK